MIDPPTIDASLDRLRRDFEALCDQIEAPAGSHDWFRTRPEHNGSPHVEFDGAAFDYVVTERGQELERRRAEDPERALYWLMRDVTFRMAQRYAAAHRVPDEDARRPYFRRQEELLGALRAEWGDEMRREHEDVLSRHPFVDA
jgi:hypothetical protein